MDKQIVVNPYKGMLVSGKKEQQQQQRTTNTHNNVNKPQKHYPKYRNPDTNDVNKVPKLFYIAKNN